MIQEDIASGLYGQVSQGYGAGKDLSQLDCLEASTTLRTDFSGNTVTKGILVSMFVILPMSRNAPKPVK